MSANPLEENLAPLKVINESQDKPLRECVSSAMARYFDQLNGEMSTDLYQMVLAEIEHPLLESVMRYTGGNQTRAAKLLGLNRGTLRKKLKQYELDQ